MIIPEIKARPIVAVLLALSASDRAIGRERDHPADHPIARPAAWHGGPEHAPLHQHLDARFAHGHYYFDPGYSAPDRGHRSAAAGNMLGGAWMLVPPLRERQEEKS